MASSFIEDLLGSEVDEKVVSAVVGSLESQLASPSVTSKLLPSAVVTTAKQHQHNLTRPIKQDSPVTVSNANQSNNSVNDSATSAQVNVATGSNKATISYHTTPVCTPINIAPRPATSVSLAPRLTLLSSHNTGRASSYVPVQAARLPLMQMQQRPSAAAALTSRMVANTMLTLPRTTTAQNLIQNHAGQQKQSVQRITGKVQLKEGHLNPLLNNNVHSTTVVDKKIPIENTTQLQGNIVNHVSNPAILTKTTKPVATTIANQANIVSQAQFKHVEKLKQVAKLQGFFTKLIDLATAQSPAVGNTVRELIKAVMERKLTEEDFTAKLEKTLNSPSQPNLVNFLKQTLPFLQSVQKANAAVTAISQAPQSLQKPIQSVAAVTKAQPTILPSTQVTQQVPQVTSKPRLKPATTTTTTQQIVINPNVLAQLTPQQQQQFFAQHPQLQQLSKMQLLASKPNVVLVSTQANRQVTNVTTNIKPAPTPTTIQQSQDKSKARPTSSISAVTSGNDDDINDVACMAGVNLQEEQSKILATNSEILNLQLRSCKDSYFLNNKLLQKQIEDIATKHGLSKVASNICGLVSHATQERLMNIVEKLSIFSLHRLETMKDDPTYQPSSDIKSQLRVFEEIDEIERRKREAREREVLIRAAKSRSRQEDPEQAMLKEKAKRMQLEEEETLRKRAANKTALDAIGPRKKRKIDEINTIEGVTSTNTLSLNNNAIRNQFPRQRTRHVILKDLLLIMEQEKELCQSKLLYKSLMK